MKSVKDKKCERCANCDSCPVVYLDTKDIMAICPYFNGSQPMPLKDKKPNDAVKSNINTSLAELARLAEANRILAETHLLQTKMIKEQFEKSRVEAEQSKKNNPKYHQECLQCPKFRNGCLICLMPGHILKKICTEQFADYGKNPEGKLLTKKELFEFLENHTQ